jgi:hypothetical protein
MVVLGLIILAIGFGPLRDRVSYSVIPGTIDISQVARNVAVLQWRTVDASFLFILKRLELLLGSLGQYIGENLKMLFGNLTDFARKFVNY